MTGLELSKKYYLEYGKPMLEENFKDILKYLAIGFVGSGSERYGFDDDVSKDHDFEPGFNIFIPGEDIIDSKTEFKLMRAYNSLPKEFMGYYRSNMSPVGGNRNGVIRISEFYLKQVGSKNGELDVNAWLNIPLYSLFEATDGEVFIDNYKEFTNIRNYLTNMPDDIRIKRIASNLLIMAQSGQYNFKRSILHNEKDSAQLALYEFVNSTIKAYFLLNKKYPPYYKWSFRALKNIDTDFNLKDKLSFLISNDNSSENISKKEEIIEKIAEYFISILQENGLTKSNASYLEEHAYLVNDNIKDNNIRNDNILAGL